MIDPKSRSLEWILESCRTNKVSDPTLMEKTLGRVTDTSVLTQHQVEQNKVDDFADAYAADIKIILLA